VDRLQLQERLSRLAGTYDGGEFALGGEPGDWWTAFYRSPERRPTIMVFRGTALVYAWICWREHFTYLEYGGGGEDSESRGYARSFDQSGSPDLLIG
jgi:hypothetical protein